LVNTSTPYPDALPILLEHLQCPYPDRAREGVARALAVRDAKFACARLVELYCPEPADTNAKDGLAVALAAASDDEVIDELISLARDSAHGASRSLLLRGLKRSRTAGGRGRRRRNSARTTCSYRRLERCSAGVHADCPAAGRRAFKSPRGHGGLRQRDVGRGGRAARGDALLGRFAATARPEGKPQNAVGIVVGAWCKQHGRRGAWMRGLKGLARVIASVVAMPYVLEDLEDAEGQRVVELSLLSAGRRHELYDPRKEPGRYPYWRVDRLTRRRGSARRVGRSAVAPLATTPVGTGGFAVC
jgi:hypothetical protein